MVGIRGRSAGDASCIDAARLADVGTLFRVLVRPCIGPLAQRRLNESLGLAVGPRGVRLGADVFEAQTAA